MAETPPPSVPQRVEDLQIERELQDSYLTYAMSTIMDRALPDVRDGLKPSQRRILVAMNDLNLRPAGKHLKCAKIAGNTSGDYDLWTATRPDLASPFTNLTTMSAINSMAPTISKEPGLAPDDSALAFISTRTPDNGSGDIFISTPIDRTPVDVTNLNSTANEYHPFFQNDTDDFYFASNRPGLFSIYHSGYAIAVYIAACAVISLISAAMMPDYTGKDISAEYDA